MAKPKRRRRELTVTSAYGENSRQLVKVIFLVPKRFRSELVDEASRRRMSASQLLSQIIEIYMVRRRLDDRPTHGGLPLSKHVQALVRQVFD